MGGSENLIRTLFDAAGVSIDGPAPWDISVKDPRFYPRLIRDKTVGLGESYMDGWWDCPRIDELICRLLNSDIEEQIGRKWETALSFFLSAFFNRQSRPRSQTVARRHYDLGDDLFLAFLDPYNQYSCAYFKEAEDLNGAQIKKMELICQKIGLTAEDRLLDIGSGWGGLAKFAAERYGCRVTGVNIARHQTTYAETLCRDLPVDIQCRDYRDIEGVYDKVVSVGMFEHVGHKNYRRFMNIVHDRLADNGVFLLHTIGGNETRPGCDPWVTKYIFPNGHLPSITRIGDAVEGLFVMEDLHNLGPHYDRTLMAWNENFQRAWPRLNRRYDARFKRMWEYYLLSCAGAFRARDNQLWQVVFTKYRTSQPCCRYE